MSGRERITTLDTMKGIAMIFVIFDHCGYGLHPIIDHIEVPVFFLISGFLFSAKADFMTFVKRKAFTLLVPYFVFSLLYVVPYMTKGVETGLTGHLFNLLAAPANYPLWFIKALFWALIGYYWLLRLVGDRPLWVEAGVNTVMAICVAAVMPRINFGALMLTSGLPQGIEAIPLIGFGHVASRVKALPVLHRLESWLIIIAVAAVGIAAYYTSIDGIRLNVADMGECPGLYYPSVLCCGALFAALCSCLSWLSPLNYVGRHSVTFFGFHAIAIFIIAETVAMPPLLMPLAVALLCVPVAEVWQRINKNRA